MLAILSRLFVLFINYISRDLDNTKILLYKLFFSVSGCQTCMHKRSISYPFFLHMYILKSVLKFKHFAGLVFKKAYMK